MSSSLPTDAIKRILREVGSDEARNEFIEGIDKRLHMLSVDESPQNIRALVLYVAEWAVSLAMGADPGWRTDVDDCQRRLQAGELGDSITTSDLRRMVTG